MTGKESYDEIDISDEESGDIHPNIDKASYKRWKEQKRKEEKQEKIKRLEELRKIKPVTNEIKKEIKDLEEQLKPKCIVRNDDSFRTGEDPDNIIDFTDLVVLLIENLSLENFVENVLEKQINLSNLENFVYYNLSENIKDGNDDIGIILSRIVILVGYAKVHGKNIIFKLMYDLKDDVKSKQFDSEVYSYFLEAKDAILSLNKQQS